MPAPPPETAVAPGLTLRQLLRATLGALLALLVVPFLLSLWTGCSWLVLHMFGVRAPLGGLLVAHCYVATAYVLHVALMARAVRPAVKS